MIANSETNIFPIELMLFKWINANYFIILSILETPYMDSTSGEKNDNKVITIIYIMAKQIFAPKYPVDANGWRA